MENGAFALKEQMLHFHNIFKYMIFQKRQKALLWSNGLMYQPWYAVSSYFVQDPSRVISVMNFVSAPYLLNL